MTHSKVEERTLGPRWMRLSTKRPPRESCVMLSVRRRLNTSALPARASGTGSVQTSRRNCAFDLVFPSSYKQCVSKPTHVSYLEECCDERIHTRRQLAAINQHVTWLSFAVELDDQQVGFNLGQRRRRIRVMDWPKSVVVAKTA